MKIAARRWALEVRPDRGGRICSLRLDGEEVLDQGIGVDQPTADGFVEGGAWGWDEMVPTVEATGSLPDHGEAWRVPWSVVAADATSCAMQAEGRVLSWRLDRRIELGDRVRVTYALSNTGRDPIPGYWCAHPLFRYEAGMEIDIGSRLMGFAEGKSGKFFLPRGEIDRARLRWKNRPGVEIAWDRESAPYCGVWICNGDLGGYRQVAIEPATGGGDRPDSDEPPPQLASGQSLRWWMEIRPL
jgi:galactose mutarotase-like enzyme